MRKLIITERQYKAITALVTEMVQSTDVNEEIDPSEAYTDEDAIQTVFSGRRDVCVVGAKAVKKYRNEIKRRGFSLYLVPENTHGLYLMYNDAGRNNAEKLSTIMRRNHGYLPVNTPEETYVIGRLLQYHEAAVRAFVLQNFPDFKFY